MYFRKKTDKEQTMTVPQQICLSNATFVKTTNEILARLLREVVKYYFADFFRKGGTPPPLRTKFSPKKSYGFGGYPPPPLYGHSPEKMSSKSAKNGVFCPKNTCFWSKK